MQLCFSCSNFKCSSRLKVSANLPAMQKDAVSSSGMAVVMLQPRVLQGLLSSGPCLGVHRKEVSDEFDAAIICLWHSMLQARAFGAQKLIPSLQQVSN